MTRNYYLRNIWLPVILAGISVQQWVQSDYDQKKLYMVLFCLISGLLCPFAKKFVEDSALKFSKAGFWNRPVFTSSSGGSLTALLFFFTFILAIPLSAISFLLYIKKP